MKEIYDYSKLRGRIIEKYGTITNFSRDVGEHLNVVSDKLNNKKGISRDTMIKWGEKLDIAPCDYYVFFITQKVNCGKEVN